MKILIGGLYAPDGPQPIGGTQTWMMTIANALLDEHEVDFWMPNRRVEKKYDFGIFAHGDATLPIAYHWCRRSVLVTHGIVEDEKPIDGPWTHTFATSEEVADHWGLDGPILRQPIDMKFWRPSANQYNRVCRFAYRRGETHSQRVSERLSMGYTRVSGMTPKEARDIVSESAIVHASGRAALEAMACNVPTIIYDHRQAYQGHLLNTDPLSVARQYNYSGRNGLLDPTEDDVMNMSRQVISQTTGWREYIETYHDSRKIAEELLCYSC